LGILYTKGESKVRYLTIVYALPYDYDVRDLTSHEYMSACSWSHAIEERKAADTRIVALMQIPQPKEK